MTNQELIQKYPFLQIRNAFTDEIVDSQFTMLDEMPDGWKKAFGE